MISGHIKEYIETVFISPAPKEKAAEVVTRHTRDSNEAHKK
jgi:hypothetical protein